MAYYLVVKLNTTSSRDIGAPGKANADETKRAALLLRVKTDLANIPIRYDLRKPEKRPVVASSTYLASGWTL